jgi:hypothetical protein
MATGRLHKKIPYVFVGPARGQTLGRLAAHGARIRVSYLLLDQEFIWACIERVRASHAELYYIRLKRQRGSNPVRGPRTRRSVGGSACWRSLVAGASPKASPGLDCQTEAARDL